MRIELVQEKQWFWRLVADNGQTVLTSETYANKWSAQRIAKRFAEKNSYELRVIPRPEAEGTFGQQNDPPPSP